MATYRAYFWLGIVSAALAAGLWANAVTVSPPLLRSCAIPEPTLGALVVAVAVANPSILSTVSIGGDDRVVRVVRIHVEEGNQPLFVLVVADQPVIFSVSGAVGRVERFITFGREAIRNAPLVGVTGIVADKVTQIAAIDWSIEEEYRALIKRGVWVEHYGPAYCAAEAGWIARAKEPGSRDKLFSKFSQKLNQVSGGPMATDVFIPSGRLEGTSTEPIPYPPPRADFGKMIEAEIRQEWRGGIETLDPARVVSLLPVKSYEVLPGSAGMLQLLDRNVLELVGTQSFTVIGLDKSPDGAGLVIPEKPRISVDSRPRAYRIAKQMRFPAELHGRWDFTFCLPSGISMPEGDPGSSVMIRELDGKVLKGGNFIMEGELRPDVCKDD